MEVVIVYNATLYENQPDRLENVRPMHFLGHTNLWKDGSDKDDLPDNLGHIFEFEGGEVPDDVSVYLDIEHWHETHGFETETVMLRRFAEMWKEAYPTRRAGYYRMAPVSDYWATQVPETHDLERYQEWRGKCFDRGSIVDVTGISHPSLYTHYPDKERWCVFAARSIAEARKYGQLVVPFLWPQYHVGADPALRLQYLDVEYFRMQWELCRALADGVVIWGGWKHPGGERMQWDDRIEEIFAWA